MPNQTPHFDRQETFTGRILHSVDYKDAISNEVMGKKVVVVGVGNSAVDVAVSVAELEEKNPSVFQQDLVHGLYPTTSMVTQLIIMPVVCSFGFHGVCQILSFS